MESTLSFLSARPLPYWYITKIRIINDTTKSLNKINKHFFKLGYIVLYLYICFVTLKLYIMNSRPIYQIASEIKKDWVKPNYAAKPYIEAMESLTSINDKYGWDSGKSVVLYFLSNAGTWKGETAKRIKAELKAITK